jgi:hypothetical protein
MTRTTTIAAITLLACLGCKSQSKREPLAVDETQPWEFPGEEVSPEDIPEGHRVEMSQPGIEGTLTDEDVRGALRPQIEDLEKCYGVRLARHCKIKGHMRMALKVGRSGTVTGIQVLSDTTRDTRLGDCVSKVIRKAGFGKTDEETRITVTYTFTPPDEIRCE